MTIDRDQRKRNLALLVVLVALVVMFYFVTVVKIAGGFW